MTEKNEDIVIASELQVTQSKELDEEVEEELKIEDPPNIVSLSGHAHVTGGIKQS